MTDIPKTVLASDCFPMPFFVYIIFFDSDSDDLPENPKDSTPVIVISFKKISSFYQTDFFCFCLFTADFFVKKYKLIVFAYSLQT